MTSLKFIEIPLYTDNPAGNPTAGFVGLYPRADGLYLFISSSEKKNVVLDQVVGELTPNENAITPEDNIKLLFEKLLYQFQNAVGGNFLSNSESIQEPSALWLSQFLKIGKEDGTQLSELLLDIFGKASIKGTFDAAEVATKLVSLIGSLESESVVVRLKKENKEDVEGFKVSLINDTGYENAVRVSSNLGGSIILFSDGRVLIGGDHVVVPPDPEDPEAVETIEEVLPEPRQEKHQVFGDGYYEGTVKGQPAVEDDEFTTKAQLQTITVSATEPENPKTGDIWIEP